MLIKRSYTQKVGGRMLRNIIYAQLNQFSVPETQLMSVNRVSLTALIIMFFNNRHLSC